MNDPKRLHVPSDLAKALREVSAVTGGEKGPATKTEIETRRDPGFHPTRERGDRKQKRNCIMLSLSLPAEIVAELDVYCRNYGRRRQEALESALDLYFATMAEEQPK